jgi:hypothetical protein
MLCGITARLTKPRATIIQPVVHNMIRDSDSPECTDDEHRRHDQVDVEAVRLAQTGVGQAAS